MRPGRFEVHIEIGLPDLEGRVQIFNIHTARARDNNMLGSDVDIRELATLATNFSGAEISGLVRSAQSFAINKFIDVNNLGKQQQQKDMDVVLTRADFMSAFDEVGMPSGQPPPPPPPTTDQHAFIDPRPWEGLCVEHAGVGMGGTPRDRSSTRERKHVGPALTSQQPVAYPWPTSGDNSLLKSQTREPKASTGALAEPLCPPVRQTSGTMGFEIRSSANVFPPALHVTWVKHLMRRNCKGNWGQPRGSGTGRVGSVFCVCVGGGRAIVRQSCRRGNAGGMRRKYPPMACLVPSVPLPLSPMAIAVDLYIFVPSVVVA